MLRASGIIKSYGARDVLRGVDLEVRQGEILGLVGANGAGKSTFISIVAGLCQPDAGEVLVGGVDAQKHPKAVALALGLAPQELGIYPTLTARQNLHSFAGLSGMSKRQSRIRVDDIAELLGLTEQLDQRAEKLSGGQKRRLHTGLAVLHRPRVLFLDEPTVGADVSSRAGILAIVAEMAAEGTAIVYTTHYLDELEKLEAEIAVLDNGVISERGSTQELLKRWARASVQLHFGGAAPSLRGWETKGQVLSRGNLTSQPGEVAAEGLASLGDNARDLVGVEVTQATLESAFLAITGRAHTQEPSNDLAA